MRIVQLMTDRSRYFNPSKNYWFSFNAFLISLIGLYFRFLYGFADKFRFCLSINKNGRIICFQWMNQTTKRKAPSGQAVLTRTTRKDKHLRIVQLVTDRSRYFNTSKNYWFSFNAFLISLIGLYFRCLSFRVVLVNTTRPEGAFLFVVWFIHRFL
jgi:hypothetical protein